jgi:CHAT domain-containing protein
MLKSAYLSLLLFSVLSLHAKTQGPLFSAETLLYEGKYQKAALILNSYKWKGPEDNFNRCLLLAELSFSVRETNKFVAYTDSAYSILKKSNLPTIYLSLIYRNYSRYHHYNIVRDKAIVYADSSLINFYKNKVDYDLIPVYSLYQAKASALRNVKGAQRDVKIMFDSALSWLNFQIQLPVFHKYSINRSYGNFLLDLLTNSKYGTPYHDSVFLAVCSVYMKCSDILTNYYPNNRIEMSSIKSLLAIVYYHHKQYKLSFNFMEKAINCLKIYQSSNHFYKVPEIYYSLINWQNTLAEKVLKKDELISHRIKYLNLAIQQENDWIRWTFNHRSDYTGSFRLMYSNSLYSFFMLNSQYLYKHTTDKKYLQLFFHALQRSKFLFYCDSAEQVIRYNPQLSEVKQFVNATTSYLDYASTGMLYEQKGFVFVSTNTNDTILEFGQGDFHYKFYSFSNTDSLFKSFHNFKHVSYSVYQEVFAPVTKILPGTNSKLIIAPSSGTAGLNFDFLISDTAGRSYRKLSYLFYRYNIRYTPCLAAEKLMDKRGSYEEEGISNVVYAPQYNAKYYNLPFLRAHANRLKSYGFNVYDNVDRSKIQFLEDILSAQIIHMVGHCMYFDNQYASDYRIILSSNDSDSDLRVKDLLRTKSSSRLVVLALCETGQGELFRNDVINSFSNYFIRTGVHSVVYSISKLDDKSASFILEKFYHYLNMGLAKDVSLRKAKFDYLNSTTSADGFSPLYWAALVLQGDDSSIKLQQSTNDSIIAIPFLLFTMIFLMILGIVIAKFLCR